MCKYLLISMVFLSVFVTPLHAEEDQGYWASMLWGTAEEPGVFRSCWNWLCDSVDAAVTSIKNLILAALPSGAITGIETIKPYYEAINAWLPLGFAIQMTFGYWSFCGIYFSLRFVKSWIPTVSG